MDCRPGCGACCTAPSISSPIPGMPDGKAAGVRCAQLDAQQRCLLFGHPGRPAVCGQLRPSVEMCGSSQAQAVAFLSRLERLTQPDSAEPAAAWQQMDKSPPGANNPDCGAQPPKETTHEHRIPA